jgi:hypothetical protein
MLKWFNDEEQRRAAMSDYVALDVSLKATEAVKGRKQ